MQVNTMSASAVPEAAKIDPNMKERSAFAEDIAKTNLTAILEQRGLEKVRS